MNIKDLISETKQFSIGNSWSLWLLIDNGFEKYDTWEKINNTPLEDLNSNYYEEYLINKFKDNPKEYKNIYTSLSEIINTWGLPNLGLKIDVSDRVFEITECSVDCIDKVISINIKEC